jgi:hypothetical protein
MSGLSSSLSAVRRVTLPAGARSHLPLPLNSFTLLPPNYLHHCLVAESFRVSDTSWRSLNVLRQMPISWFEQIE